MHSMLNQDIRTLANIHHAAYGKPVTLTLFRTLMNLNYGWTVNREAYSVYCCIINSTPMSEQYKRESGMSAI